MHTRARRRLCAHAIYTCARPLIDVQLLIIPVIAACRCSVHTHTQGFIYVACVAVLPEVLATPSGLLASLAEALACAAGVSLMVAVAAMEHSGEHAHSH
jgi:hypothetical protein